MSRSLVVGAASFFPSVADKPVLHGTPEYDRSRRLLRDHSGFSQALEEAQRRNKLIEIARSAKVSRPRSKAVPTLLASLLARDLISPSESTCVFACSSTAAVEIALAYELVGLNGGWKSADPFWLQNTLPSAAATSMPSGRHTAVAFSGGLLGVAGAFRHARAILNLGLVNTCLVIVAETDPVGAAGLDEQYKASPGAIGVLLSADSSFSEQPQDLIEEISGRTEVLEMGEAASGLWFAFEFAESSLL